MPLEVFSSRSERGGTTELLDAVTLALTTFDPARVLLFVDRERSVGVRVEGSFARWVIALHGLVQAALDLSSRDEVVLVALATCPSSAHFVVRDRRRPAAVDAEPSAIAGAREVVEALGGALRIAREPYGAGASVHLVIPTATHGAEPRAAA